MRGLQLFHVLPSAKCLFYVNLKDVWKKNYEGSGREAERRAEMERIGQEEVGLGLEGRGKKCGGHGDQGGVFHTVTLGTYHYHKKIVLNI